MFPTLDKLQKLLVAGAALILFVAVFFLGGWGGLQVSKRQFEAEAQNIVAVLRSGMSVVDGVATSLEASHSVVTNQGYGQLKLQLAKVLSNYDFVTGIGRFEKTTNVQSGSRAQYPLALAKSRLGLKSEYVDLTGLDLGSTPLRSIIESSSSIGKFALAPMPASWQRPGHLLVVRTSAQDRVLKGGYLLELDVEEMASSGGVELKDFGLSLTNYSEQGEFSSIEESSPIYERASESLDGAVLSKRFDPNRWLTSFDVGDKTLILEVNRDTGLSAGYVSAITIVATLLPLMFLSLVHVNGKRRQAQKLQKIESEKLYREQYRAAVTLASIGDGVVTTDADDKISYSNGAAEALLGFSSEMMQGKSPDEVIVLRGGRSSDSEEEGLSLVSADGGSIYVNKNLSDLKDSDGNFLGQVIVLRDVSAERSLTQSLQYKINHDSLTGLSNRLYFEQQMERLFKDKKELDNGFALCFIDLDRFKEVNDTCGHGAGDELLVRIGQAFKGNIRDTDLIARLGGDEFAIIIRYCSQAEALVVAERIRSFFQSFYFEYEEHVFPVRCSIGVVHFYPAKTTCDDVLKAADTACYNAKNNGRNSICEGEVGHEADETSNENSVLWLPLIKDAIKSDKFTLFVQSIASTVDGTKSTHEILLRMIDEDGSLIRPMPFMKTAARYGLSIDIDRWVVSRALAKIAALPPEFQEDKFAINLSSLAVVSMEFTEFVSDQISLSGVDASRLCFDICENDVLKNPVATAEFCKKLQSFGCGVVLDDFGAAMTSLSAIKTLPVNALKIDGSLIAKLHEVASDDADCSPDYALVKSINSFATSMGLSTIAEQVEDAACLEVLNSMQIEFVQGNAVEVPIPFEDFVLLHHDARQRAA